MRTFIKSKRVSNYPLNCLKTSENNNSSNNNKLTKSVDNQSIKCKNVDSNSNNDANNHQCVTLTYLHRKKFLISSPSITKKEYQLLQNISENGETKDTK